MSVTGKIAVLCRERQYALIVSDDAGDEVFADAEAFGDNWRKLEPGARVRYSSLQGTLGMKAYNVTLLTSKPSNATSPARMCNQRIRIRKLSDPNRRNFSRHHTV